jgi:hypothetical protein
MAARCASIVVAVAAASRLAGALRAIIQGWRLLADLTHERRRSAFGQSPLFRADCVGKVAVEVVALI